MKLIGVGVLTWVLGFQMLLCSQVLGSETDESESSTFQPSDVVIYCCGDHTNSHCGPRSEMRNISEEHGCKSWAAVRHSLSAPEEDPEGAKVDEASEGKEETERESTTDPESDGRATAETPEEPSESEEASDDGEGEGEPENELVTTAVRDTDPHQVALASCARRDDQAEEGDDLSREQENESIECRDSPGVTPAETSAEEEASCDDATCQETEEVTESRLDQDLKTDS